MKLADMKCKQTKATGKLQKLFDGGGLFLQVNLTGGKYWKMKYYFMGKEKQLSFGEAKAKGLPKIDKFFVDKGVSGGKPLGDRPQGKALLDTQQSR